MSKPTLVLVHGSWHCTAHYAPLETDLTAHGFKCVKVALPSCRGSDQAPLHLSEDIAAVRSAVETELATGNNVVVVAHSFGGNPTNSSLEGLDTRSRTAAGEKTSVTGIVFICALPLPANSNFVEFLKSGTPIHEVQGEFSFPKPDPGPAHFFYNDLSPEEAEKWIDLLKPQSMYVYAENTTYAAYNDIQSYYLYCGQDNAIPYLGQQAIVNLGLAGGAKIKTTLFEEASHSPFLSMPEKTSEYIRNIVNSEC
ncbi:Hypothetical protein R9X50_00593800 [Acrodontium crateriforme]|uniref:AB hydrolase-1 domain-containing protein n=1 Tax=Acrodontium crateriforme TaxID=150365 RepID=A0AAQ3M7H5_9PEZI|nr:Hypothetical protein R9X50_00593800 [Acrodontium crateriforme]